MSQRKHVSILYITLTRFATEESYYGKTYIKLNVTQQKQGACTCLAGKKKYIGQHLH